jgi:hypothetical protein
MVKEVLVSKTNNGMEYVLYTCRIPVMGEHISRNKGLIRQEMMIKAYGITVSIPLGREHILYDSGCFSGRGYRASSKYSKLVANGPKDLEEIRSFISKEYNLYCNNPYGNPFSELANAELKRLIYKQIP